MITQELYLKHDGAICPNCKSQNVEGHDLSMGNLAVYQNCMCLDCKALWTDTYELKGYGELTDGDGEAIA